MVRPTCGTWSLEFVTEKRARAWLADMAPNRIIRKSTLESLTLALESGAFEVTHEGIAFNHEGQLLDGQTRLTAIANTGISVWLWVYRGLRSAMNVNLGGARSVSDSLTISGTPASRSEVGTLRRMLSSTEQEPFWLRYAPTAQMKAWFDQYSGKIREANLMGFSANKRGLTSVCVVAPAARAAYTADPVRLSQFVSCFMNGVVHDDKDIAAIKLRDLYLQGGGIAGGSQKTRVESYLKTEYALQAFLNRRPISRVLCATHELFPIPNDPSKVNQEAKAGR